MGSAAEDALISYAPVAKTEGCIKALQLLKDCGTSKCYDVLYEARKSRNPMIKQVGTQALREVRLREKEAREGEAEDEK
jgi:hypothetical protein